MHFESIRRYARLADDAWLRGDMSSFDIFSRAVSELMESDQW